MLDNLQVLRAFAAINVVVFHAIGSARDYGTDPLVFAPIAGWGMNGVDLFFVLSGFVMVIAQARNPKTPGQFIRGRIARVVPIYWLMTLAFVTLLVAAPSLFREAEISLTRALASFLFYSELVLERSPYIYVGWSLEFEMLFYVVFALALFLPSRVLAYLAIVLGVTGLQMAIGLSPLMLEFVLGVLAGIAFVHAPRSQVVTVLAASVGAVLFLSTIAYQPPVPRWIMWGLPSALLTYGLAGLGNTAGRLGPFLGDASYSIYLVQVFTIPAWFKISADFGDTRLMADMLVVGASVFTVLVGVAVYWWVERPATAVARSTIATRAATVTNTT